MLPRIITQDQIEERAKWVDSTIPSTGDFPHDVRRIEDRLRSDLSSTSEAILGHLRLCGTIPESYRVDSSTEKAYSKYTDFVISLAFEHLGFRSLVLVERADSADVECVSKEFSFVADAKAFRLSRTAKNQKDFKIEAMDAWKRGKPYALVVCPIHHLPASTSQIYQQATSRSVCIFSYTHLSVLIRFSMRTSAKQARTLLGSLLAVHDGLNPTKESATYWRAINGQMLSFDRKIREIWLEEKQASIEAVHLAKEEALTYLSSERERIMRLTRAAAIREVLKMSKLESKIKQIESMSTNGLLDLEDGR